MGRTVCPIDAMTPLMGRRIALLERRSGDEIAALVHRCGGVPISAPAIDEVLCHDDFNTFFDGLMGRRFSLAIFLSGAGTQALLDEARNRGQLSTVLAALRDLAIACRGAKPAAVLRQHGLRPRITTAPPHTTQALLNALTVLDVRARGVVLVHSGERNAPVAENLRSRAARLQEIRPYEWTMPDDLAPIAGVVREALARRLDAVLFTSHIQCRHLFQVAADMSLAEGLRLSLNGDIVVGAVGPACAGALQRVGITPDVVPLVASMRSLVKAVVEYFDRLDRMPDLQVGPETDR
jgi:uroporphyrinogen-III synthase